MKTKTKRIFILLVLGVVVIIPFKTNALAFPIRQVVFSSAELVRNEAQTTNTYSKEGWSSQFIRHDSSITVLTNPCPKCMMLTKLTQVDDNSNYVNTFPPALTVAGEEKWLHEGSVTEPGNYRLSLVRNDTTLLNTHVTYRWRLNYNS